MKNIRLNDKEFGPYISAEEIQKRIIVLGQKLNEEYTNKKPLFIAVLNGSFMFAGDLMKHLKTDCEISFVKVASYSGLSSQGNVTELIGLSENVEGREIVIIEDIVDTGLTIEKVVNLLKSRNPASVKIATLLFKPEAYKGTIAIDYKAFEIPNNFIVGYGLDYDGLGRNLPDIYTVIN